MQNRAAIFRKNQCYWKSKQFDKDVEDKFLVTKPVNDLTQLINMLPIVCTAVEKISWKLELNYLLLYSNKTIKTSSRFMLWGATSQQHFQLKRLYLGVYFFHVVQCNFFLGCSVTVDVCTRTIWQDQAHDIAQNIWRFLSPDHFP